MKNSYGMVWVGICLMLTVACGKKSKSEAASAGADPSSSNVLAGAVPATLAISAFPQATASLRLAEEEKDKPVSEKIAENDEILRGKAEHCFDPDIMKDRAAARAITCYEFDSEMDPFTASDAQGVKNFGTKDGKDSTGEACMVAFARSQIDDAVRAVERALAMVNGMICQGKKAGLDTSLPEAGGDPLDLKDAFKKEVGSLAVSTAQISREADIDGAPVYKTSVVMTDPFGRGVEVNLVHSPTSETKGKGVLWYKRTGGEDLKAGDKANPDNAAKKVGAMSINYEYDRDSDESKQYTNFEVRRAHIAKAIAPFTDAGLVNYAGIGKDATNADVDAINYIAFNVNPTTNEGKLSYWMNPGGSYEESARGFLFAIEKGDSGELKGCGTSGATANVSIRKALLEPSDANVLKPVRYWHPQHDQNSNADKDPRYTASEGFKITEQCFKQDTASQIYEVDTDVTKDARGYDVKDVAATNVLPPQRPEQNLDGKFVK